MQRRSPASGAFVLPQLPLLSAHQGCKHHQRPGICQLHANAAATPGPGDRTSPEGEDSSDTSNTHGNDNNSNSNNSSNNNNSSDHHETIPGADIMAARSTFQRAFLIDMSNGGTTNGVCTCIWCNGTGLRACAWCAGRGLRDELRTQTWDEISRNIDQKYEGDVYELPERIPTVCSACSGSKKLRCAFCLGSGVGSYGFAH